MLSIKYFDLNEEASVNGVWFDVPQGARIKVARANNTAYMAELHKRMAKRNASDDELASIDSELVATYLLKDWEGFLDENDEEIAYSEEQAIEWVSKYKEFSETIVRKALQMDSYRNSFIAEVAEHAKK